MALAKTLLAAAVSLGIPAVAAAYLAQLSPVDRLVTLGTWQYFFFPFFFVFAVLPVLYTCRSRNLGLSPGQAVELALGVLLSAAGTIAARAALPPLQWIQWDETALLATSQNMHFQRFNAYVNQSGVPGVLPTAFTQDQRPPLFPFLVSVAHDLLGARIENTFLVNGLVLFALLLVVFIMTHRRLGLLPAVTAQLLLLSEALILRCATSGGFDLLALLFLLLAFAAALRFVARPALGNLNLFLCAGILFSYCRYESVVIFAVLGAASFWLVWRARRWHPRFGLVLLALPPLLTPLALYSLQSGGSGYSGFYDSLQGQFATPFRLGYFGKNFSDFVKFFFDLRPHGYFFGPLHLLGLGSLLFAVRRSERRRDWALLLPAAILTPLLIILCYVAGGMVDANSWRLYLPVTAFCAVAPLFLLRVFPGRKTEFALLLGSLALALLRLPAAVANSDLGAGYETKAAATLVELLHRDPPVPGALFVFEVPAFFLTRGQPAIHPAAMRDHWRELRNAWETSARGKIYFADIFPADAQSPVKLLARNFDTKEIHRYVANGVSVRILELQRWPVAP